MHSICVCGVISESLLNDNRVKVPEAHDDIHRDRGTQVISIQTQVPGATEQMLACYHNECGF